MSVSSGDHVHTVALFCNCNMPKLHKVQTGQDRGRGRGMGRGKGRGRGRARQGRPIRLFA